MALGLRALKEWFGAGFSLPLALGISFALHGLVLSLHFTFPDASRAFQDKALDIILVNSKSARRPVNAQALAQANLDGGGNVEDERRATTPLPPSPRQQAGSELEQSRQRQHQLEAQQQRLLSELKSKTVAPRKESPEPQPQPVPAPVLSGRDLASSALAMARMEAEVAKNVDEYNKRPRKKNIGTRTDEYRFAQYVEDWRLKVERIGTLNYPEAARGKLYGRLVLSVTINADGSVERVELERTSGQKVLDEAALRIVRMAGPYSPFPADIRREVDQLVITRTWFFTSGDQVTAR